MAELRAFRDTHGHVDVDRGQAKALYFWLARARKQWREGTLAPARRGQLRELGVDARRGARGGGGRAQGSVAQRLRQLERWRAEHGHVRVKAGENPALSKWLADCRLRQRNGTLSAGLEEALTALGVDFRRRARGAPAAKVRGGGARGGASAAAGVSGRWRGSIRALRALHRERGHWRLSPGDPQELRGWFEDAYQRWRRGALSGAEAQSLEASGLAREFEALDWAASLRVLEAYRKLHGDADPPPEFGTLHTWVRSQRRLWLSGQLPGERVWALQRLGVRPARGGEVGSSSQPDGPPAFPPAAGWSEAGEVSPHDLYKCLGRYIEVKGEAAAISLALNRFTIPAAERFERMRAHEQAARFERTQYELDAWFAAECPPFGGKPLPPNGGQWFAPPAAEADAAPGAGRPLLRLSAAPLRVQQALALYAALHAVMQQHALREEGA